MCSLYEILVKANKQVLFDYRAQITDHMTISGLAVKVFLSYYYKHNIPNINKPAVYRDIKQAYYGGITEVYKPSGSNLFYYDVNSLYPHTALQDMPGLKCSRVFFYEDNQDINNLFGFFYCSIDAPLNAYLGILPLRTIKGLIFPLGKWEGWYFSEELKFASKYGYKIKVLNGYIFDREKDVFNKYVNKVYQIKSTTRNAAQKAMAKSLLNNLLGRFGINMEKPITEIWSNQEFKIKMCMYKIVSYKIITQDKILVTYIPKLDYDIITSHKLDFVKVVKVYKDKEFDSMPTTSVVISAAVTAYARIHMTKLNLNLYL